MLLQAMEKMVGVLDKSHLRPMQKESYLCMSRCCDSAAMPADLQQWYVPSSSIHLFPVAVHTVNFKLPTTPPIELRQVSFSLNLPFN
jgi:hypothetical protein